MKYPIIILALLALVLSVCSAYEKAPTFSPNDPFYGDYMGTIKLRDRTIDGRAIVVAEKHKDREFQYRVLLIDKNSPEKRIANLFGKPSGGRVQISGDGWNGVVENGKMSISRGGGNSASFEGKFTVRTLATMGLKPPVGATVLLPYRKGERSDLDQWQNKQWKLIDDGSVEVGKGDNLSKSIFGAVKLHVEFCNPYICYDFGQGRGNSGIYLQARCEVQVLDSFGEGLNEGNCGGIYNNAKANVEHVSMPPAKWQTYEIEYYPALFDLDGNKIVDPRVSVIHNGVQIHKNVDIKKAPTPAAKFNELAPMGPLMFQDHGNPVRFRNVWLVNIDDNRSIPQGVNLSRDAYLNKLDEMFAKLASIKQVGDDNAVRQVREYLQNGYNLDMLGVKTEIEKALIDFVKSGVGYDAKQVALDELGVLVSTKPVKRLDQGNVFPVEAYFGGLDELLGNLSKYDYRDRGCVVALKRFVAGVSAKKTVVGLQTEVEKRLVDFVKSDASDGGKLEVCRHLSVIGGEVTVKGLGPAVAEDGMTDLVLFAIERIDSDDVDEALLTGLSNAKGKTQVAIINSLGRRKCSQAVDEFAALVKSGDKSVAVAAARGLGNIGSDQAAEVLEKACRKVLDDDVLAVIYDSLLGCAANADVNRAYELYSLVYRKGSASRKGAGLVGMVSSDCKKAGKAVIDALASDDERLGAVAASMLDRLEGVGQVNKVDRIVGRLSPAVQVQAISSLSRRSDEQSRNIVLKGIDSGGEDVRIAALKGLGVSAGRQSDVALLAGIAAKKGGAEGQAAAASLVALKGAGVDLAIVNSIAGADAKVKVELIRAIGSRVIIDGVAQVISAAKDADASVRSESYKVLPLIAGLQDMDEIVALVVDSKNSRDRSSGGKVLVMVADKTADVGQRGKAIWKVMDSVTDNTVRGILLRALGKMGDRNAMPLFIEALKSDDVEMRVTAVNALGKWHNSEPVSAMIEVAEKDSDARCSILALKGYVQLIKLPSQRSNHENASMLARGLKAAKRAEEKSAMLKILPDYYCQQALDIANAYLGDNSVKRQADKARAKIAGSLKKGTYSASASRNGHNANKAYDNDPSSRWDTGSSMKPGQWFILNIGSVSDIQGIVLDTAGSRDDYPRGCEVFVSTDGSNWGDAVAKVAEGIKVMEIDFGKKIKASHIKIVQSGDAGNFWSIHEINVLY